MNIDKSIISKLEDLSMLRLSHEERDEMLADIQKLVEMIDVIQSAKLEPSKSLHAKNQILRPDTEKGALDKADVFNNSRNYRDDYFVVPKIIKKENE